MTDDLTAFIEARLDEDEALAKAAAESGGPAWFPGSTEDDDKRSIRYTGRAHDGREWDFCIADRVAEEEAAHIARHDPARTLRQIEAQRNILRWHADFAPVCPTLGFLAAVWSDHPDYRRKWAP